MAVRPQRDHGTEAGLGRQGTRQRMVNIARVLIEDVDVYGVRNCYCGSSRDATFPVPVSPQAKSSGLELQGTDQPGPNNAIKTWLFVKTAYPISRCTTETPPLRADNRCPETTLEDMGTCSSRARRQRRDEVPIPHSEAGAGPKACAASGQEPYPQHQFRPARSTSLFTVSLSVPPTRTCTKYTWSHSMEEVLDAHTLRVAHGSRGNAFFWWLTRFHYNGQPPRRHPRRTRA